MFANKQIAPLLIILMTASPAWCAFVWQSTFDSTADGVVDVKNLDTSKVMIGPASGGRLQITTKDKFGGFTTNDRAGRPLGSTLNGNNSFSALYKFRWSTLVANANGTAWESVGFIGSDACGVTGSCSSCNGVCNNTNQAIGALLQHHQDATGANFVTLGIQYSPSTTTNSGGGPSFSKIGSNVNIGTDLTADYYLAIGYDGASSHVLSLAFFDVNGNLLGSISADLDASSGGLSPTAPNTVQTMLNSLAVTHLGWNDYISGNSHSPTTVWQVDSLSYYSDARGAFDAVPSQATGACCLPNATCGDTYSQFGCLALAGIWENSGSTCGSTTCPAPVGGCCNPDGSCTDASTSSACTAGGGTWQGANSACSLSTCPQPPTGACCSSLDGSCSDGKTQFNCVGTWEGANTVCANITCPPPPPGACCLPNGACIAVSSGQCALQCGTFSGAGVSCASANCPQLATGACCLPSGTCSMTHEADCTGAFHGPGSDCASVNCQPMPSLVWWSNFASSNDGVVDVENNNVTKDLIGPQCNGREQIHNQCPPNSFETNDRGGRPLGITANGNTSMSGLYRFTWSQLDQDPALAVEVVDFIGSRTNATEQLLGVLLEHNKPTTPGTDYFVTMCSIAANSSNFELFKCGAGFDLGPDAQTKQFQLVISYDGSTHLLTHAILDDQGNLLGTAPAQSYQTWDLDTPCPCGAQACQGYFWPAGSDECAASDGGNVAAVAAARAAQFNNLALTHLGWSDYTAFSGVTENTIWQVDSLAYFNRPGGAYDAVFGPVPRGACCQASGTCADNETQLACLAESGSWNDAASTCLTTTCAGACCLPDGSCTDNQTVPQCNTAGGSFNGTNTTCATASCPLPPCHSPNTFDADGDGDVDMDDFGVFQRCYTGSAHTITDLGLLGYCHCLDHNDVGNDHTRDGMIDGHDFSDFLNCASANEVPAPTTGCAPLP